MSLAERNRIVPQMADYDLVGDQWVPYLMRVDRPNRSFPSVSTDEHGFRRTVRRDGLTALTYLEFMARDARTARGILLGSSAAFGVGATHDRYTVPSVLNRLTALEWFNFGGRAFNSTQEVLLFLLHLPVHIRKLVVLSGVNNLVLPCLAPRTSPVYNSFFYQSVFERAMEAPPDAVVGVRRSLQLLWREVRQKLGRGAQGTVHRDIESQYGHVLACFSRDMQILRSLAQAHSFGLYFALQPVATWINKDLTEEEGQLFRILDSMALDWKVLADHIGAHRRRYVQDLEAICAALDIPLLDLNHTPRFAQREWLFVDRVHLTDRGYEVTAEILAKEFRL